MTARELEAEVADELERCEVCGKLVESDLLYRFSWTNVVVCEDCYVDPPNTVRI